MTGRAARGDLGRKENAVAIGAVDPEGIVEVDGARWRARTNRATPLASGDPLRVAAIDGVTLDVEPLEGAARDYREMRHKSSSDEPVDAEPST